METYLGLDLGGTKLLIGEMDSRGNILRYKKYDSGYFNQQAALEIIKSSLDDYIRTVGWYDQKPVAMGVGRNRKVVDYELMTSKVLRTGFNE